MKKKFGALLIVGIMTFSSASLVFAEKSSALEQVESQFADIVDKICFSEAQNTDGKILYATYENLDDAGVIGETFHEMAKNDWFDYNYIFLTGYASNVPFFTHIVDCTDMSNAHHIWFDENGKLLNPDYDGSQEVTSSESSLNDSSSDDVPAEYRSALAKAESYSETMHMSKQGLYDQLTSEYGEQFSAEAAQYAIDNMQVDWNANALATAKNYQSSMNMSPAAIHDQLTSEYGEQFTQEEADYAIAHLND